MIIDFRSLGDDARIDADLCIIGAGPAGISLAREFIGTGVRVCLLESGGYEPDDDTQNLYAGENIGLPYFDLDAARIRTLGGTTYHWEGQCAPLAPVQFENRDWVPHSGWPITRIELDPYYVRAHDLLDLGEFKYGPENWDLLSLIEPDFNPEKIETRYWRSSPPTRFGPKYQTELESAGNIAVYLYANVINIQSSNDGIEVAHVDIQTLDGKSGQVTAKAYVLACGGVENPRLMLASNTVESAGLGNRLDLVGRYFMEHFVATCADIVSPDPSKFVGLFAKNRSAGVPLQAGLCPAQHLQREKQTLASSMSVEYVPDTDSGVGAAKSLMIELRDGNLPDDMGSKLWRMLADIDEVGPAAYRRLVLGEPLVSGVKSMYLLARSEQAPNPTSRVTLAAEKDALGMPRIQLDWRVTELDKHTLRVLVRNLATELGRLNLARVKMSDWLAAMDDGLAPDWRGAKHHMGTTRMADDPKKGVVDKNCRVHGNNNLYIAGSSVFPTSGYANPTLTIVALSLRLADHLKRKFA